ncbi:MAG: DotU family type VI secretion system protein, partial [Aquincola sp.]|nr:DotU family type VI secretion system protein [Aquincola sp.]
PLLQAAAPLLGTAARLRSMPQHPNPAALRAALAEGIKQFESTTRAQGLPNEQVIAGRYVLCTFIDECASSTPWGGSGAWGSQSLLVLFHNEVSGGEKVFQLMGKLAENVPANRPLLELMYMTLALGFEGRYRVIDNGRAQLETVRERLAQMLKQAAPTVDKELSPAWAGVRAGQQRLRDGIPVWVVAAVTALVLMLVFIALRMAINARTDPTFQALQSLDVKAAPPAPPPVPAPQPRLAGLLAPDIQAGLVEVRDYADRSVIVIRGDGFFEPASADVADRVKPLLGRIAAALKPLPGPVLVTGHSDNQPIRSVRYPSNWHLSQERADSVKALLAATLPADRLRAEGRADSEPVDSNDTPAGRAKNRRVEITLASPPQS